MTAPTETTTSRTWRAVTAVLAAQRAAVLTVIEGLDDDTLRTPVVPSGWTPLGLVEHLGRAETMWFQHAVAGGPMEGPRREGPEPSPFVTDRPRAEVIAFYRRACARADEILAGVEPEDPPRGWLPPELLPFADDVAMVCVHMIEETARHLGHLDLARELLDGRTGLGPR